MSKLLTEKKRGLAIKPSRYLESRPTAKQWDHKGMRTCINVSCRDDYGTQNAFAALLMHAYTHVSCRDPHTLWQHLRRYAGVPSKPT